MSWIWQPLPAAGGTPAPVEVTPDFVSAVGMVVPPDVEISGSGAGSEDSWFGYGFGPRWFRRRRRR